MTICAILAQGLKFLKLTATTISSAPKAMTKSPATKPTPAGKVGMLNDRPVFIGVASGGVFSGAGANQPDFLSPYLSAAFECIGLRTLQFVPVQATAFLDLSQAAKAREAALSALDLSKIGGAR